MKIIKEKLTPVLLELEEEKVDMFSVAMFFSSYTSELLKEINDKDKAEVITKAMLDGLNEIQ